MEVIPMKTECVVRIRPNLKIFSGYPRMTPYVSVFFILLLFFMIGSSFVPISGISVDLPVARTKTTDAAKRFIVTVDKNGTLYFNDILISNMDVLRRNIIDVMSRTRRDGERETLVIRADRANSLATLTPLLSLAEELNLNAVMMASPPPRENDRTFIDTEN